MPSFTAAFEGPTDEPVVRRLSEHVGATLLSLYPAGGKTKLDSKLSAYNNAARHSAWIVLRDFDHDATCPGELVPALLPHPAAFISLRLAVRATEAWLLADDVSMSEYLSVRLADIPSDPETLTDPRQALLNVARKSRRRAIREDMVPRVGGQRAVGPGYAARVIAYTLAHWDIRRAAGRAPSLQRCIDAFSRLAESAPY